MSEKKEILFVVKPLFTKGEKKECICCPKEHIFSYNYSKNIDEELYAFIRTTIRKRDDIYAEKKFRIVIETIEKDEELKCVKKEKEK